MESLSEVPLSPKPAQENGGYVSVRSRTHPPFSILTSTLLFCAETVAACVMIADYSRTEDAVWMSLTIVFMLVPSIMVQLTLTFIHRDLGRDRPLVLLMHLLQLGPIIRYVSAIPPGHGVWEEPGCQSLDPPPISTRQLVTWHCPLAGNGAE